MIRPELLEITVQGKNNKLVLKVKQTIFKEPETFNVSNILKKNHVPKIPWKRVHGSGLNVPF